MANETKLFPSKFGHYISSSQLYNFPVFQIFTLHKTVRFGTFSDLRFSLPKTCFYPKGLITLLEIKYFQKTTIGLAQAWVELPLFHVRPKINSPRPIWPFISGFTASEKLSRKGEPLYQWDLCITRPCEEPKVTKQSRKLDRHAAVRLATTLGTRRTSVLLSFLLMQRPLYQYDCTNFLLIVRWEGDYGNLFFIFSIHSAPAFFSSSVIPSYSRNRSMPFNFSWK